MTKIFLASSRDIHTPIRPQATTNMSGLKGNSLIYPNWLCDGKLLHFTSNFQATYPFERALEILECGGLLAIKAHAIKNCLGYISPDGLDEVYRNYLDVLFKIIIDQYGDTIWWTSMGEITRYVTS
ncbi:hypothetical protein ACFL27_27735 [candidate division CSSED10-310 bacterium]|uniref:Uncharacterized protein n=1 Tax=candidate division CSSED10-310 bacterium TaxID=2855610 RepID=A0ABV6Z6C6_UNCC1